MVFDILMLLVAVLAGGIAIRMAYRRSLGRIQEARQRVRWTIKEHKTRSEAIRTLAKETLKAKQVLRVAGPKIAELEIDCEELDRVVAEARASISRVTVLDERCLPDDRTWLVDVQFDPHGAARGLSAEGWVVGDWRTPRRFLVWAKNETVVTRKVQARYPHERGFRIARMTVRPD